MRKFIVSIVLCLATFAAAAQTSGRDADRWMWRRAKVSYDGTFAVGMGAAVLGSSASALIVSTRHGIRIGQYFFAGVGVDYLYNRYYPRTMVHDDWVKRSFLTPHVDVGTFVVKRSRWAIELDAAAGLCLNTWFVGFDNDEIAEGAELNAGLRVQWRVSRHCGLALRVGYRTMLRRRVSLSEMYVPVTLGLTF